MLTRLQDRELSEVFLRSRQFVIDCGYSDEIEWQRNLKFESLTESIFLSESAWVILNSGMRESVVRGKFKELSEVFFNWESAERIHKNIEPCRVKALGIFNHKGKISAILSISRIVSDGGFESIKNKIEIRRIDFLVTLPFIGPITSYHLAKNIGMDVVKPDRHLVRIADVAGFDSPDELCGRISECTGEYVAVIDVVLWRYATLRKDYLDLFRAI